MVRGWLRIVEVLVAILIVFSSVLIVLYHSAQKKETTLCGPLDDILTTIQRTPDLRIAVLTNDTGKLAASVRTALTNPLFLYQVKLCLPDAACTLEDEDAAKRSDVCSGERLITPQTQGQNLTKVKVFIYRVTS